MKTSNKIILALGIIPFIVVLMMLFPLKSELEKEIDSTIQDVDYSKYPVKTFDFTGFDEVEAKGNWEIDLSGGDQFNIELRASDDAMEDVAVTLSEKKLMLKTDKKSFTIFDKPRIKITMPTISRLNFEGHCNIKISNFKLPVMDIGVSGVADITGTESAVEKLSLYGGGAVNLDFFEMPATNAFFNFNGVYMMKLNMDGGELSGMLNGPGSLVIEGNTSRDNIKTGGKTNIIYKSAP